MTNAPQSRVRSGKPALAALIILILVLIQTGTIAVVFVSFREIIAERLDPHLDAVAEQLLVDLDELPQEEVPFLLRRLRDSHRLDDISLSDADGRIIASASAMPVGFRNSPAAVDPRWRGQDGEQNLELLGEHLRRHHRTLPDGRMLCIDAWDPVPGSLSTAGLPLGIALAVVLGSGLLLGLGQWSLWRLFARSRHRMLEMQRLANVGAVAAGMAHEVRNPLGVILASSQLLTRDQALDAEQRELLDGIIAEVRRADHQLDTFLEVSRDLPLKRRPCDLAAVLDQLCAFLAERCRQEHVGITRFGTDVLMVEVDERRVRQALLNLLLNALQALASCERKDKGITVQLDDQSGLAVITVSDNGPGIPAEWLSRVREPFVTTREHGTGLGLSSAISVFEHHQGSLSITSSDQGCSITCTLPRSQTCDS